jgi:Family of unknown function (DUF6325)
MTNVTSAPLGPLEYLAIDFPNGILCDGFGEEIDWLTKEGSVRLLDFVYLTRDSFGTIKIVELDDIEILGEFTGRNGRLMGREIVSFVGEHLRPGSSVALLLLEDLWATPLADAITRCGGSLVEGIRIPAALVEAAMCSFAQP